MKRLRQKLIRNFEYYSLGIIGQDIKFRYNESIEFWLSWSYKHNRRNIIVCDNSIQALKEFDISEVPIQILRASVKYLIRVQKEEHLYEKIEEKIREEYN